MRNPETRPVEQSEDGPPLAPVPNPGDAGHSTEPRLAKLKLQPALLATGGAGHPSATDALWASLERVEFNRRRARRDRIVTFGRSDPAHASFDILRTKVLRSLRLNNWTTVAITSPEPGCGKSLVAVNLAFIMANVQNCRVVLLDLDLR